MAKRYGWIGVLLIVTFSFSTSALADGLTFGAKTGPMRFDNSNVKDDPTNAGVTVGYELGLVLGDLGFEGEFTTSMDDGTIKNSNQKFDVDTVGLLATYRSPGFIYLKARYGFISYEVGDNDDTATSMGLGLGVSLGLLQLELEYTKIDEDLDFISVGVVF